MHQGRITLYREGSWRDGAQPYRVWIDDRPVGRLYRDGALSIDVEPGEHRVRARAFLFGDCEGTIMVGADRSSWLVVRPGPASGLVRLRRPLGRLALEAD